MRITSKASRTAFLAATTAAVVLVAALSGEGVSATTLASGKPLQVAEESYEGKTQEVARPPLSAGIVTRPLGAGNVFGGKLPDIFYVSTDSKGSQKFKRRFQLTHPFKGLLPPPGHVVEHNGTIHGFFVVESNIVAHTVYDRDTHGFVGRREMHILGLPRPPASIVYLPDGDHRGDLVFEIPDRVTPSVVRSLDAENDRYRRSTYNPKDGLEGNYPRDSTGMWRLKPVYSSLYSVHISQFSSSPSHSARRITPTDHDMEYGYCGLSGFVTQEREGRRKSIVVGSHYNGIHLLHGRMSASSFSVRSRQPLRSAIESRVKSRVLKHPSPLPMPMAYPSKRGYTNLIVGGEGALQFYRFRGFAKETAMPLFWDPRPVVEVGAMLYGGSHPALSVADWDGDGRTDLVVGNAEGRVLFFKNVGTNAAPKFLAGISVKSSISEVKNARAKVHPGLLREIVAKAGHQALNGPAEASYGYATPSVVDWNGDGFQDLVMTDALGRHTIYLSAGLGNSQPPILQPPIEIFCDDKEVQGPWRVKPGTARYQGRLMYVAVDTDMHLHAYYKMDNQNVKDAGKLKLIDGKPINTHYLLGSAVGRIHINVVDFDVDNVLDLVLAVPAHASVPTENVGIPQSLGLPGGAILFLKGKKASQARSPPVFFPPEVIHHDGRPLFIGREDGSVAATSSLGNSSGPHLVVGEEGGRIVFYDRSHLSCKTYNRFPRLTKSHSEESEEASQPMKRKQIESYLKIEWESAKDLDLSLVPELLLQSKQGKRASLSGDLEDFGDDYGDMAGQGSYSGFMETRSGLIWGALALTAGAAVVSCLVRRTGVTRRWMARREGDRNL